jgi:hypothetical protein
MFHSVLYIYNNAHGVGMSETRLIVRLMDSKLMRSVRVVTIYFAAHSRLDPLGGKFHVGIASLVSSSVL